MRKSLAVGAGCLLLMILVQPSAGSGSTQSPAAHPQPTPGSISGDVEHGRYIVEHVAMCVECHSPRDRNGEIIASDKYLGGPLPVGAPPWSSDWALTVPRNKGLPGYDDAKAMRLLT